MKMVHILSGTLFCAAVSLSSAADIPKIAQMFQKVQINAIPKSTEWNNAMVAVNGVMNSMNVSVTESKALQFFGDIQKLHDSINRKSTTDLQREVERLEQRYAQQDQQDVAPIQQKKGFFARTKEKAKAFFSRNKNNNQTNKKNEQSDEDRVMDLLWGAFDLLKAKINSLQAKTNESAAKRDSLRRVM